MDAQPLFNSKHQRLRLCEGVMLQPTAGEAVALNLNDGQYYLLNGTGARMLEAALQTSDLATAIDQLSQEYLAPAKEIAADFEKLLGTALAKGLVSLDG